MTLTVMKKRYQVTLSLELFDDIDPNDIDWSEKLGEILSLEPAESVEVLRIKEERDLW